MNVVILAFNYGKSGRIVNGPGMCLENFVRILLRSGEYRVNVFTEITHKDRITARIRNLPKLESSLKKADVVVHWSGITPAIMPAVRMAQKLKKKILAGPNLIDTVEFDKEQKYLSEINVDKIITVNERLKYLISKRHSISTYKIGVLMIGPDLDAWFPTENNDGTILWKGNGTQFVKDVDFALELQERLKDKYEFRFIGYPKTYDYHKHIALAKRSKLYICTSLSETMGLALAEQWAAGIPSVTHPKIYMHGINYATGIIASKTIDDYAEAIDEIMGDDALYRRLSIGARKYAEEKFSDKNIIEDFMEIVNEQS